MSLPLGIDLGGTHLRLLLWKEGLIKKKLDSPFRKVGEGKVLLHQLYPSLPLPERPSQYVFQAVDQFLQEQGISQVSSIGISVAGRILQDEYFMGANTPPEFGELLSHGERGISITKGLKKAFPEARLCLENDATATARFLASYGAKLMKLDEKEVFYITLS
ncbi:MAG: ROK family protein, partial [Planctomycetota bacterium]